MNIIKRDNQRAVIHLSKIGESGFYVARAFVFTLTLNGSYASHLVGVKRISTTEAEELRAQIASLSNFNITLIEAESATQTEIVVAAALIGSVKKTSTNENEQPSVSIPSPYASKIDLLEAFFSTQKTRAPTR